MFRISCPQQSSAVMSSLCIVKAQGMGHVVGIITELDMQQVACRGQHAACNG